MERGDLKIIVGGADPRLRQRNRKFVRAFATNSRLVGVVVLYFEWEPNFIDPNNREMSPFHQFFYVETSEVGIESYKSIHGDNFREIDEVEKTMIGGLGAQKVPLSEKEAYILIKKFAEYNKKFNEKLPPGYDEYGFLLEQEVEFSEEEYINVLKKTCVEIENTYELINYFLIRYFARDFEAVELLLADNVKETLSFDISSDALNMNKTDDHVDENGNTSYISESLIEKGNSHRIVISDITVFDGMITSFEIISNFPISGIETAMKLERPEFVTVFEVIADETEVREVLDKENMSALVRDTEAGRLYLNFNDNNDHIKKPIYRLNDDVKGMIYFTIDGQIILSAYSLSRIRWLEKELISYPFGLNIFPLAKYEFREDVFYDFVKSDRYDFVSYIEEIFDFGPEDED